MVFLAKFPRVWNKISSVLVRLLVLVCGFQRLDGGAHVVFFHILRFNFVWIFFVSQCGGLR